MQIGVIGKLAQHEPGNIGTRDFEREGPFGGRKAVLVVIRRRAVGKGRRADNNPVEAAVADMDFLGMMIGECRAQQQTEHQPFPEEVEHAIAVPSAQRGFADQPLHPVLDHPVDNVLRTGAANTAFAARSKRNEYSVMTRHRLRDGIRVEDVARILRQIRMLY